MINREQRFLIVFSDDEKERKMNIGSRSEYPSSNLSNFHPHAFSVDGIECASMEGFLQSLKFKNPEMQIHVCTLVGIRAKMKGKNKKWWRTQTLWWKGLPINRHSEEYQYILDMAYRALSQNKKFQIALLATHNAVLKHTIGKKDKHRTVLTQQEFCSRLTKIRETLK